LVKHPRFHAFAIAWRQLSTAALAFLAGVLAVPEPANAKILVFAAASTTGAVGEIAEIYGTRGLGEVRAAFAGSSALARQIVAGAPADIYISANPKWMDYLADEHAIEADSRIDLVANGLVLVAPADSRLALRIEPGFPLAEGLDGGRLAMGDPDHVPAGIYARAALIDLGVWPALVGHLALTADVRAALALVERGEAAAGIVYATDAAITSRVRLVDTFPPDSHPPIAYPAAMVAGRDRPEVRRFFAFLTSAEAAAVFARHGFVPPIAKAR
jgi:molybdate transport system substrate-binding protein